MEDGIDRKAREAGFRLQIDEADVEAQEPCEAPDEADVEDAPHDFLEQEPPAAPVAAKTPAERIAGLFENMYPYRRDLLAVMARCVEPAGYDEVCERVAQAKGGSTAAYAADNYLDMLVGAGALAVVDADGEPYVEHETAPVEVERDGEAYLEVAPAPEVFWLTTQPGAEYLDEHSARRELEELFCDHMEYLDAFQVMLEMCGEEGGASIAALKEAVNSRPEMVERKKTAQFLLDYLGNAGAVRYDGGWKLTQEGRRALEALETREG